MPLPPVLRFALRRHPRGGRPAIQVDITRGAFAPPALDGQAIRLARPLPVRGVVGRDGFWLQAGRGGVVGQLAGGRVRLTAPSARWLAQPTVLRTLLPLALALPLARRGRFLVHAAAAVDPRGRGYLLFGGGGVGKTTTVLALVRRGWRYVGDDAVLLRRQGARIRIDGFWDEPRLAPTPRLASLRWLRLAPHHPDKRIVDVERSFGEVYQGSAPLEHLIWLAPPGSRPPVASPPASAYLARLMAENTLMLVSAPRARLALLARLAGASRRHRFVADARLVDRVAALAVDERLAKRAGRR